MGKTSWWMICFSRLYHRFILPLRRKILVAEQWDRTWPPIGLRAPPATKVIVAPGSAKESIV
jgi:hypothetical protein